jgi:hypothetical protein
VLLDARVLFRHQVRARHAEGCVRREFVCHG